MKFLRRAPQLSRHTILLCLLSLLWLQFSGAHLHTHDEHGMHIHGAQSLHHSDLDHDHEETFGGDIDITPAAVLPAAWLSADTGVVFALTVFLLFFAFTIAVTRRAPPRQRWRRYAAPFYLSPPLRAPPAQP